LPLVELVGRLSDHHGVLIERVKEGGADRIAGYWPRLAILTDQRPSADAMPDVALRKNADGIGLVRAVLERILYPLLDRDAACECETIA
jgi:hypothetical protein